MCPIPAFKVALFAAVLAVSGFVNLMVAAERPNVIVILTDDQGWGDLSINGNTNLATPNIDSIGRQGARFDRFYVCPVCSPTRSEFLTGRYHPRGGVHDTSRGGERLNLGERTVAEIFKAAGYQTAAFGKWHNGTQYPYHPNARGFDEYYGFCSGHWGDYFSPPLEHNGNLVTGKGFLIDDFTDHAIRFVEQNKERPFFLYLPFPTPHAPMQVPDEYWGRFKDKKLSLTATIENKEDANFTRAALAMVENIDHNVGRLLKRLDELQLSENTIVVFFCDNGPNSERWNGGMKGKKGSTDEGGVRSPLLVRWPDKIKSGKLIAQISGAIDLLPTLAELAQVPISGTKPLDGVSLVPLLSGEASSLPDRKIFSHWAGKVSVRTQHFRLDDQGKLYDMLTDPGQSKPVNDKYADLASELKADVASWKKELLTGLNDDKRPFTVGHPDSVYSQLPARDGDPHGNIKRSAKAPNCSYFTNWLSTEDNITWPIEVIEGGRFAVEMHYTCEPDDVGTELALKFGKSELVATVTEAHNPPARGNEHDRVPRNTESLVKDFKPMPLGVIQLEKGSGELTLQATKIPGKHGPEIRLLMLRRVP
ncbi:MAG: arylsulfatase [Pirellulaceae bacterium]|nr:arylsulfatase [Pirellulaceae bacterium]